MKIKIGNYPQWIGPYQIAEKLMFWTNKYENDSVHKFGDFLAHGFHKKEKKSKRYLMRDDRPKTILYKLCSWIHSFKKRTVEIKIDRWDSWNADYTLSLIAVPLLKQLRDGKHGAGQVDDEDVPEGIGLRSTEAPPKENEWDTDENWFKRWNYVLDEMIWAHEQIITDDEPEFWITKPEGTYFEDLKDKPGFAEMKHDVEGKYDHEAAKAYNDRINKGLILFGKYYRSLWD